VKNLMLPSAHYSKISLTYLRIRQTILWKLLTFTKLPHCMTFNCSTSQLACRNNSIAQKCLVLLLKSDGDRYNRGNAYLYRPFSLGQFPLIDAIRHVLFQELCQFLKKNYCPLLLGTEMKSLGVRYL
jgi:hypothetical protein